MKNKNPFSINKQVDDFVNSAQGETSQNKNKEKKYVIGQIYFYDDLKDRFDSYRREKAIYGETKEAIAQMAVKEWLEKLFKENTSQEINKEYVCNPRTGGRTILLKLDIETNELLKRYQIEKGKKFETKNYIVLAAIDYWLKQRDS